MKKITLSSNFIIKRLIALLIILPFIIYGYYRYSAIHSYNQQYHLRGDDSFFSFLSFKVINNTYAVNDQYVYFAGRKTSINRHTFEALNDQYAKDNFYIYYGSLPIKGLTTQPIDQASFEIIDDKFSKNKDYVFYTYNILKKANPNNFKILNNVFSTDGQHYYYNGELLDLPIDIQTFEITNQQYSKDKNHVYYHTFYSNSIIENADPNTFEHIINKYYKDKNNVYFESSIIEDADPETFEYVIDGYTKDKNYVFNYRGIKLAKNQDFPSKQQVQLIVPNIYSYVKDTDHVFYNGKLIEKADPKSFELIVDQDKSNNQDLIPYSKDNNNVYFNGKQIAGANPKTFELVIDQDKSGQQYLTPYSKDSKNVYFNGELIVNADPKSFINIYSHYGADNSNAYYKTTKLANADIQLLKEQKGKLKKLGYGSEDRYLASDQNVFYYGKAIKNADPDTFQIEQNYNKDKNHIFINQSPLESADPNTFEDLRDGFAKDKQHVFFNFKLLENSDSTSFQFINTKLAKDNTQIYLKKGDDQILIFDKTRDLGFDFIKGDDVIYFIRAEKNIYTFTPADIVSFKVLDNTYAVDKYNVYYILADGYFIIKDADPASFQIINKTLQKDKNNIYFAYKKAHKDKSHDILKKNNIDLSSFSQINDYFYKDKNHIYVLINYSKLQPIKEADVATFTYIKGGYAKDKNYIYTISSDGCGRIENIDIIKGIDTATYTRIDLSPYGKDKYQVYYNYVPLLNSDPSSFIIFKDKHDYETTGYGKDNKHVYFKDKQLVDADPNTFHTIIYGIDDNHYYGKDKKAIYIYEQKINVNYNSFYFFKGQTFFARDKDNIYLIINPIALTNKPDDLTIADQKIVLKEMQSTRIDEIFSPDNEILNNSKQKIAIHNIATPLKMADINTFKMIKRGNDTIAIDKNYAYFYQFDYIRHCCGLCPSPDEFMLRFGDHDHVDFTPTNQRN